MWTYRTAFLLRLFSNKMVMNRFLSLICVVLVSALVSFHESGAGVDATLAPTTTTSYGYNTPTRVFGSLKIDYAQYVDGARIKITGYYQRNYDRLFLRYYGGAHIRSTFNTATGTLTVTGKATGVEFARILNSVYFQTTSRRNYRRTVTWNLGANVYYNSATQHYYLWVSTAGRRALTWTQARSDCASRRHLSLIGYLVTITSSTENYMVRSVSSYQMGWTGGSDYRGANTWRWVVGPEGSQSGGKGRIFYYRYCKRYYVRRYYYWWWMPYYYRRYYRYYWYWGWYRRRYWNRYFPYYNRFIYRCRYRWYRYYRRWWWYRRGQ